jgi:transcriptional regulator NrdR family protein
MNWQDTVMTYEQIERKFAMTPEEVMWQWLSKSQAQLSFEAGEQSKARLIADLQETVNSMLQDNSELTVALEHERQEGRREGLELMLDWDNLSIARFATKYPGFKDCETIVDLIKEAKAKWFKETQHG